MPRRQVRDDEATFAEPYPHYVAMAEDQTGMDEVTAAEMVQFCMVVLMRSDPLPYDSQELASLTACVETSRSGSTPRWRTTV